MGYFLHSLKNGAYICIATAVLSIAFAACILWQQGYRLLSVQTGSMAPVFFAGDAVVTKPVMATNISPGDIISYHNPEKPSVVVSHRVIGIDGGTQMLLTKGDNVGLPDRAISPLLVEGRVVMSVPVLGYMLNWLRQPLGLIICVYTPAAFILAREVQKLAGLASWSR